MKSDAGTVAEYIASLPDERQAIVVAIRDTILANLDGEYDEGIRYGMISYFVPHSVYPAGYHADPRQPLPFAALASQKRHVGLYLMGLNVGPPDEQPPDEAERFRQAWVATGKPLRMGKSCVNILRLDDVPLDVVGETIRRLPAKRYIARYEAGLGRSTGS